MAELDVSPVQFRVRANAYSRVGVNASTGATVILVPVPGGRGEPGPPGDGALVPGEVPGGVQDGVNVVFTTAHEYAIGSTAVYRNGLREFLGLGYTESGDSEITFDDPPFADDLISIDYVIN